MSADWDDNRLPTNLPKPALRALAAAGYTELDQLAEVSEAELRALHGIGPNAVEKLRRSLATRKQTFGG